MIAEAREGGGVEKYQVIDWSDDYAVNSPKLSRARENMWPKIEMTHRERMREFGRERDWGFSQVGEGGK